MLAAMAVGFLDDADARRLERICARRVRPRGEHRRGHGGVPSERLRRLVAVPQDRRCTSPPWLFIVGGSILIWVTINSTNATDGVDGLSGSLSAMALVFLGAILYTVLGHKDVSAYLLLPHYANGPAWACWRFR